MNHYTCQQRVWNRPPRCFWKMALVVFLQCGGWKCVITHAVKEIRFVLTLLVKKMMKCKEATRALISFYKAISIVLHSSDPHSVISNTSVSSGQPIRSGQCTAAIVHCPWQACKVYCTTKLCGNLGCALQWRKWNWNESYPKHNFTTKLIHKSWWWSAIFGNFGLPGFWTCSFFRPSCQSAGKASVIVSVRAFLRVALNINI